MANTTAVGGGGVIRAIVPANLSFAQYDHFAYNDQNVVCADRTSAGLGLTVRWPVNWRFIKLTASGVSGRTIEGRVPNRPATVTEVSCTTPEAIYPGGEP
jgi:hypothetical protein